MPDSKASSTPAKSARKTKSGPKSVGSGGVFTAPYGYMRRGRPQICIQGPREGAEVEIHFALSRRGADAGVISLMWPSDFVFRDAKRPNQGVSTLEALSSFSPIGSITPTLHGQALETGSGWALSDLYAGADGAFAGALARRRGRRREAETLLYAAYQVLEHDRNDVAHRCAAAAAFADNALQLDDAALKRTAHEHLTEMMAAATELSDSDEPTSDRSFVLSSLDFWLWQTALSLGEMDAFETHLDAAAARLEAMEAPNPAVIRDGCPTILMRAYVHLTHGARDEAGRLADVNADLFSRLMPLMPRRTTLFLDSRPALECVALGLRIKERMAAGLKPYDSAVAIRSAYGEGDTPASKRQEAAFDRYCRQVRDARRPSKA